jgi:hypothetical protein
LIASSSSTLAPPRKAILHAWAVVAASAGTFWLLMMCVHEGGHALGAWLTGGHVVHVVLSPFTLSRTDIAPNPSPLAVVWCGPLLGAAVPATGAAIAFTLRWPLRRWLMAFAGFCLVANGLYLASGIVTPAGDTQDLLRLGTPPPVLAAVGVPLAGGGLFLWHRLGPRWGLAAATPTDLRRWAWQSPAGLVLIAAAMLVFGSRG